MTADERREIRKRYNKKYFSKQEKNPIKKLLRVL